MRFQIRTSKQHKEIQELERERIKELERKKKIVITYRRLINNYVKTKNYIHQKNPLKKVKASCKLEE